MHWLWLSMGKIYHLKQNFQEFPGVFTHSTFEVSS